MQVQVQKLATRLYNFVRRTPETGATPEERKRQVGALHLQVHGTTIAIAGTDVKARPECYGVLRHWLCPAVISPMHTSNIVYTAYD